MNATLSAKQFGLLLNVDLSSGRCRLSEAPAAAIPYLGGRGFNIWHLYRHLPCGIDPLSPDNLLMFSCGLLTGSPAPASARLHINALSPQTGILGSSNIGGYAGAWLRSHGIASVIVGGKSNKPVYLEISPEGTRLRDASHLWGCDAFETQDLIKRAHPQTPLRILTIGPGGENGVTYAAIISERDHAAGRTGMGLVMGSKNLKAIVITRGEQTHFPAQTPSQRAAVKSYTTKIRQASEYSFFSRYGGAGYIKWANALGIMGSKNYSAIGVNDIEKIDGRQLEPYIVRSSGCYRCPVQCKADLKMRGPKGAQCTRPEFEPIINLGPKCGLDDLDHIIKLDNLCGRLGIDSTSAASALAFAMDLNAKNLLPEDLLGGLDLTWGNASAMELLLHQIVNGEGLGKILRLGVKKAAERIGGGASLYAAHAKGLELSAYHPAAIMGSALGYAVSSRGGDYNNIYASLEYSWTEAEAEKAFGTKEAVNIHSIAAKGRLIRKAVTANIIIDCLGLCKVPALSLLRSFDLGHETELINGLTGQHLTGEDLSELGTEIASLEKRFNIRHAPAEMEDTLPQMFFETAKSEGLTRQNFESMRSEYYDAMGWGNSGIPPGPDDGPVS